MSYFATKVYIDKVTIAAIYAALGNRDRAFAALRQAAADRAAMVSAPRFFPWLASLFDDPRFARFEYDITRSAIELPADAGGKTMNFQKFLAELKRRNVYKVAGQQVSRIEVRGLRLIRLVRA